MSSNTATTAGESHSGGVLNEGYKQGALQGLLGMEHQSFCSLRTAHTQSTHMHKVSEAMNSTTATVQKSLSTAGEASGSQAGDAGGGVLKEHDYIGLSDHPAVPQQHSQSQKVGKELNIRRTELQLGLPGSPENDTKDSAEAAAGQRFSKPLVGISEQDKNESQEQGTVKDKEVADNARVKQQQRVFPADVKHSVEKHAVGGAAEDAAAQPRAPFGWPPVQSFRKNSLPTPQAKSVDNPGSPAASAAAAAAAAAAPQQEAPVQPCSSLLVKVYMDGVTIGRKVNLRIHSSYDKLSVALEEMFRRFISGQAEKGHSKAMKDSKLLSENKKFNFIYGSDYVLTYEDKDGDLMLVGDVPWGMFVGNVKRLRIMKGSEAIGLA